MIMKCPGSQKFSEPQPEEITCPFCNRTIEIWTDEKTTKCQHCKKEVVRKDTQSCLDWCKSAQVCLGKSALKNRKKSKK